jgi:thioesterase domain-containing protein
MLKIPTETLVNLNNVLSKQKHNFFVLPGIEGNCDVFKELGAELENFDIQLYGLNYSQEVPNDSIESIAKFYLNIINETLKESNSFTLGAYSFGGLLD